MPWQGRQRFSIAHPSIPSRWEGKKYRLSNDLFPLPTGGGRGGGRSNSDPPSVPAPISCTRWVYPRCHRPRPHDRWFYWVCVRACGQRERDANLPRHAGMDCRHPEHRDVNAALTPSLALDSRQSMLHDTISRRSPKAPLALGRSPAGEAHALRARDSRARRPRGPNPDRPTAPAGRSGPRPPRSRCAGPAGRAVALGTRPARRHSPLPP